MTTATRSAGVSFCCTNVVAAFVARIKSSGCIEDTSKNNSVSRWSCRTLAGETWGGSLSRLMVGGGPLAVLACANFSMFSRLKEEMALRHTVFKNRKSFSVRSVTGFPLGGYADVHEHHIGLAT